MLEMNFVLLEFWFTSELTRALPNIPLWQLQLRCSLVNRGKRIFHLTHQLATGGRITRHLAAYLLLGLGGKTSPSAIDAKGILAFLSFVADDE